MEIVQNCPLCGAIHLKKLYEKIFSYPGDDIKSNVLDAGFVRRWILFDHILKKHDSARFDVMICRNCGFVFLNPRLEDRDMKIKYNMINQLGSVKARRALYPSRNSDRRAAIIYHTIAKYKNNKIIKSRILDFGGASGHNLRFFVNDNQCYVVDYEKWNLPKGIKYLCQTVNEIPEGTYFDIILCCHVLEHLVDPVKTIRILTTRLLSGGLLYIEVPLECFFYEFKRLRDPITHINFFSQASLSYLLSSCGLRIKSTWGGLQWLIHNRALWLSMIGEKDGKSLLKYANGYKATLHQMRNPLFYSLLVYRKMRSLAREILR